MRKEESVKRDKFDLILANIQQRLFDVGAELATKPDFKKEDGMTLKEHNVLWLENVIDEMNEDLEPLTSFILPGGGIVNAFLHQSRTVCRRAERDIVRLSREEEIGPFVLPYVNRLSDALFVFGRWVGAAMGEEETLWKPGINDPDDWKWNS
jgi:cob(I)alamin adenosyltransferase